MNTNGWLFAGGICKIKTARRKRQQQKKDFGKQLLRMHREGTALALAKWRLPLIPLETPYQKGWKRTFVLRPDVAKSAAGSFYSTLLDKINTVDYSVNRLFLYRKKRRRKGKKQYEVKPQFLQEFQAWQWHSLHCKLTAAERACFHPLTETDKDGRPLPVRYVCSEPWRFVLKVSPNMITHRKMTDEVLEQQISALNRRIERHCLQHRINKQVWGSSRSRYRKHEEKAKYKNPLKNKPLHILLYEAANNE